MFYTEVHLYTDRKTCLHSCRERLGNIL
uniref:Uncharacterized protein n=1 Tax=Anguilla anguilla TaxID=7936 RepID=A0A0E9VMA3_ANGAN